MNYKELILKTIEEHTIEGILKRMVELYPDEIESLHGYLEVIEGLVKTEPAETTDPDYAGMELEVSHVHNKWDELPVDHPDHLEDDIYEDVHGKNGKTRAECQPDFPACKDMHFEETWALDFTPWNEWLGMKIRETTFDNYSEIDIVVHSLWEMTFMGFNNETIKEKRDDIDERVQSIKDGTAELIPWEVIQKELEERIAKSKEEKEKENK